MPIGEVALSARAVRALAGAVLALCVLALCAAPALAASPSVSHVKLSHSQLNSAGGKVTLSFQAKHAKKCVISASPALKHLPRTIACSHRHAHLALTITANRSRRIEEVKFTVVAKRGHRSGRKQHTTLRVLGAPELAMGGNFGCELYNGAVFCWGSNEAGQLGNGHDKEPPALAPARVSLPVPAVQISAGEEFACALLVTTHVTCWGLNERGEIGIDKPGEPQVPSPAPVPGLVGVAEISAGGAFVCAALKVGQVECWGNDEQGQVGNGKPAMFSVLSPTRVSNITNASGVASGEQSACALLKSGGAECWGNNFFGQLGDGKGGEESVPTPVAVSSLSGASGIASGFYNSCAVLKSGGVDCWGANEFGQDGNGEKGPARLVPTAVTNLSGVSQVDAGAYTSCALAHGAVDCWGENFFGQVGNEKFGEEVLVPSPVVGISGATQVAVGAFTTCAMLATETGKCWGRDGADEADIGEVQTKVLTPAPMVPLP